MSAIAAAYRRAAAAAPRRTNFLTGASVMAVGDSSVQWWVEQREQLDLRRLTVSSSFNAILSVPIAIWYASLDRRWPGTALAPMVRKVVVNQVLSSSIISPGFLLWSNAIEALLDGKGIEAARDAGIGRVCNDGPGAVMKSMMVWFPANTISFLFVPQELRVGWMSCIGVGWGGYLSFVAHREHEIRAST